MSRYLLKPSQLSGSSQSQLHTWSLPSETEYLRGWNSSDLLLHRPQHMAEGCNYLKMRVALKKRLLPDSGRCACCVTAEMIMITGRLTESKPSRHEGWYVHDVSLWLSEQQEIHESDLELWPIHRQTEKKLENEKGVQAKTTLTAWFWSID